MCRLTLMPLIPQEDLRMTFKKKEKSKFFNLLNFLINGWSSILITQLFTLGGGNKAKDESVLYVHLCLQNHKITMRSTTGDLVEVDYLPSFLCSDLDSDSSILMFDNITRGRLQVLLVDQQPV